MHLEPLEGPLCCLAAPLEKHGMQLPLPGLDDEEGPRLSALLPPVVDAHVHLFPDAVFEAIWRWFDQYGWPIRYKFHSKRVLDFLFSRGVSRVVALAYSHRPGMARMLNAYMAGLVAADARVIGLATVLPGEPGAREILREGFAQGLRGVKLHCHVQCFSPDAPELQEIYETCVEAGVPLVMHAGREPSSPAYKCDVYSLCAAERVERVLLDHPKLKLCVPHMGADEFEGYTRLLERFDTLWFDTTMVASNYFPIAPSRRMYEVRPDRILYGTDFPNLPYAWDREVKTLTAMKFGAEREAAFLSQNALALYGL